MTKARILGAPGNSVGTAVWQALRRRDPLYVEETWRPPREDPRQELNEEDPERRVVTKRRPE
jgi:hypothetical protein